MIADLAKMIVVHHKIADLIVMSAHKVILNHVLIRPHSKVDKKRVIQIRLLSHPSRNKCHASIRPSAVIVVLAALIEDLLNGADLAIIAAEAVMVDKAQVVEDLIVVPITATQTPLARRSHVLLVMTWMITSAIAKVPAARTRKKKAGT